MACFLGQRLSGVGAPTHGRGLGESAIQVAAARLRPRHASWTRRRGRSMTRRHPRQLRRPCVRRYGAAARSTAMARGVRRVDAEIQPTLSRLVRRSRWRRGARGPDGSEELYGLVVFRRRGAHRSTAPVARTRPHGSASRNLPAAARPVVEPAAPRHHAHLSWCPRASRRGAQPRRRGAGGRTPDRREHQDRTTPLVVGDDGRVHARRMRRAAETRLYTGRGVATHARGRAVGQRAHRRDDAERAGVRVRHAATEHRSGLQTRVACFSTCPRAAHTPAAPSWRARSSSSSGASVPCSFARMPAPASVGRPSPTSSSRSPAVGARARCRLGARWRSPTAALAWLDAPLVNQHSAVPKTIRGLRLVLPMTFGRP